MVPADAVEQQALLLPIVGCRYDKSSEQLSAFLGHLVSLDKLVVENGVYMHKPAASKPDEN